MSDYLLSHQDWGPINGWRQNGPNAKRKWGGGPLFQRIKTVKVATAEHGIKPQTWATGQPCGWPWGRNVPSEQSHSLQP